MCFYSHNNTNKKSNFLKRSTYFEGVTNVDDKSAGKWTDWIPIAVVEDLKAPGIVLLENSYGGRVAVGPRPEGEVGLGADRVVVTPHDAVSVMEEFPVVHPIHSQADCKQLTELQAKLKHCFTILLIHNPIIEKKRRRLLTCNYDGQKEGN